MEWVALSAGRCGSECVEYSVITILIYTEYDSRVNHATERLMHRLTATDTLMVRYTRTIFPSHATHQ